MDGATIALLAPMSGARMGTVVEAVRTTRSADEQGTTILVEADETPVAGVETTHSVSEQTIQARRVPAG